MRAPSALRLVSTCDGDGDIILKAVVPVTERGGCGKRLLALKTALRCLKAFDVALSPQPQSLSQVGYDVIWCDMFETEER